jgi:hypothetical protein
MNEPREAGKGEGLMGIIYFSGKKKKKKKK